MLINLASKSYLGNKAATAQSITPDRWFKTGDIGMRDQEGFYYIVDRRKELIKYKVFDTIYFLIAVLNDEQGSQGRQPWFIEEIISNGQQLLQQN